VGQLDHRPRSGCCSSGEGRSVTNVIPLKPRPPTPDNNVFEAFDRDDPTKDYRLSVFRDEDDMGAYVSFCDPPDTRGLSTILNMIWLDANQCEEFGKSLIATAGIIRAADAKELIEG
jgi:hypothetical protein